MSESILVSCLLDNVWIRKGDITYVNHLCEFKDEVVTCQIKVCCCVTSQESVVSKRFTSVLERN